VNDGAIIEVRGKGRERLWIQCRTRGEPEMSVRFRGLSHCGEKAHERALKLGNGLAVFTPS
jgi:hypothetical protein